ncbi:glycosyltransferase family 2 protein [Tomitella gaofuii]|uniref:glycosyltransferase family 2 protein n=1 Tax=Tomitella gaofuii TaxID=2760083 RepID=UPI0015F987C3|nr:glycosyltransferase family 2 protein [Tomitella gaofuii]
MTSLEFFIPFYGRLDYLLAAIDSVRGLEDVRWRLTVVEDRHPDGAAAEAAVLALGDERIRYRRNPENLGVNANIYQCIQLAEWDWFVLLDYDDQVLPNYGHAVESLLARHPDATMVQPAVQVVDEEGRSWQPMVDKVKARLGPATGGEAILSGEPGVVELLRGNWLYTPAGCYRRDALQGVPFRPDIDAAHDLAFVVDMLVSGGTVVAGTEVAFRYRRHRGGHSSEGARTGSRFAEERRYFEMMASEMAARGWHTASRAAQRMVFSRLNALTALPGALVGRDYSTAAGLIRHAARRA